MNLTVFPIRHVFPNTSTNTQTPSRTPERRRLKLKKYYANPINAEKHKARSLKWYRENLVRYRTRSKIYNKINSKKRVAYNMQLEKNLKKEFPEIWLRKKAGVQLRNTRAKRVLTFQLLGGPTCKRCGYDTDVRALQIDHVFDDGAKERKQNKYNIHPRNILKLVQQNPERYQILCANCNAIKHHEKTVWRKYSEMEIQEAQKISYDDLRAGKYPQYANSTRD